MSDDVMTRAEMLKLALSAGFNPREALDLAREMEAFVGGAAARPAAKEKPAAAVKEPPKTRKRKKYARLTAAEIDWINDLYGKGAKWKEIEAVTGRSFSMISKALSAKPAVNGASH